MTTDERSTKAFIALAVLALVPIILESNHDRIVQYHRPDPEAGRILDI